MLEVSRVAVYANMKKEVARRARREVLAFLAEKGVKLSEKPQLVITIGGDGTALYNKEHYGAPYFAIGSGTSFICQASFSDWKPKLSRALSRLRAEPRLLLECSVGGRRMPLALNEVGLRNPRPRVLSFHLRAGKKNFAFRADGIIFSTPTGSPAYCYSCGGRRMKKGERRYQVVAIAPFRRLFSPLILPAGAECELCISGQDSALFFIDGQEFGFMREKDSLVVRASGKKFLFAKA